MLRTIARRLLASLPNLIGVVIITFVLTRALPGDPAAFFAGQAATVEAVEQIREDAELLVIAMGSVNGTIKDATIKATTYANVRDMKADLALFLLFYNFNRGHGSLRKELKVKTPIQAIEKWYELEPKLFKITPQIFKNNLLILQSKFNQQHQ